MNKFKNYVIPAQLVLWVLGSAVMAVIFNLIVRGFIACVSSYTFTELLINNSVQAITVVALFIMLIVNAIWLWTDNDGTGTKCERR